jgi:hypothetical protein
MTSHSLRRGIMAMISYAIYDRNTGQVVHVHVEPAGLETSHEEILQLVDPRRRRALDVVQLPTEDWRTKAVRVTDGQLSPADEDAGFGAAGGGDGSGEQAVERRYELRRSSGETSA